LVDAVFSAFVNTKLGEAVGSELGLVLISKYDLSHAVPNKATIAMTNIDFIFMLSQI
jgi:hypothetical protein